MITSEKGLLGKIYTHDLLEKFWIIVEDLTDTDQILITIEGLQGIFEIKLNKYNVIKKQGDSDKKATVDDKYLLPIKKYLWSYNKNHEDEDFQPIYV